MVNAEIQVAAYFDVYFDADSKSEAQKLQKQLEKALDSGKYLLHGLSELHLCDYSKCTIDFHLKDVQKCSFGYYSPVDIEIRQFTRYNIDEDNSIEEWFYDCGTESEIESTTYDVMPDGCDADFSDIGADIFIY